MSIQQLLHSDGEPLDLTPVSLHDKDIQKQCGNCRADCPVQENEQQERAKERRSDNIDHSKREREREKKRELAENVRHQQKVNHPGILPRKNLDILNIPSHVVVLTLKRHCSCDPSLLYPHLVIV